MKKKYKKTKEEFLNDYYITCSCGYNNEKKRLENFGTCLLCGKVLDQKAHFRRIKKDKLRRNNEKTKH